MSYTQTAFTGRTGARPITAFSRRVVNALKVVEPDGVDVTKWQARKVVEALRGATAVSDGAIETLVDLVQLSWDADWKDGNLLIVWPSNQTLADKARMTVAGIKRRLRELRSAGLILAHDSAHGRRSGYRDSSGAIVEAYGIDLSPVRIRFAELKETGDRLDARHALYKSGAKAIGRVRRIVGQALAQAADMRLTGSHWLALQDRIDLVTSTAAAARTIGDVDAYQAVLDGLPALEELVGETVDRFMFCAENNPSGSLESPFIHIQTNPSKGDVHADRGCSPDRSADRTREAELPASPSKSSLKVRPSDLVGMFPTTAMYVTASRPGWADLHHAASRLRHDLGIRTGTWVDAIEALGRDGAALAVMITAERSSREEIRLTPGAYFAGMVAKARRGDLDLPKSLWGFRTERMAAH